ncbi:MAG: hypothetical protein EKK55_08540 [Rhodocyclaceae bacterium]|nr:MAG: hypothetical protein EKK55_08540 [Rhodocyclaceae bacterium]
MLYVVVSFFVYFLGAIMLKTHELEVLSVGREVQPVVTHYTPEQLTELKGNVVALHLQIEDKTDLMKESVKRMKEEIKEMTSLAKSTLQNVRKGYFESNEQCFVVENTETFFMEYYLPAEDENSDARLVRKRPMTADEKSRLRINLTY